ncbi:hypothetical protein KR009_002737 [Drosophila setifemur]|nr:hypothetical protein KR009_002737 [Drosophila setifemur]
MDKRSLCLLVICINVCLVIWLVSVQQPPMLEPDLAADSIGSSSSTSQSPPSANGWRRGIRRSWSASGGNPNPNPNPNPNQIPYYHMPSRTAHHSSTVLSFNDSLVSNTIEGGPVATPPPPLASQTPAPRESSMQLMDLPNFAYTIQQPPCDSRVQALVLVHSAISNHEKRQVIRRTWADRKYIQRTPLRVIFLVGGVGNRTEKWQHYIEKENNRFGDIVQGNFDDAYRNMTYKHVMALKWFNENCAHAQLLVKVDDDVYMNTPQLVKLLEDREHPGHELLKQPDLLLCRPVRRSRVKRTYRSKWRVTYKEYPYRFYPPYCPGMAIVYAPDVVRRLFEAAQKASYFWVDDVLVTGILAQETGIEITKLEYYLEKPAVRKLLKGETNLETPPFLFTHHAIEPDESAIIWQMTVDSNYTLATPSTSSASVSASASASVTASASSSQRSRGIS